MQRGGENVRDFYIIHEREFVESRTFRLRIPTFAITLKRDEVMQSENPEAIVAAVFEDAVQRAARRYQYSPDDKVFRSFLFTVLGRCGSGDRRNDRTVQCAFRTAEELLGKHGHA